MSMNLDYEPVVLTDTSKLTRDEWLAFRKKGIGGSDAAAVMGVSPFATCRDLYYDKTGQEPLVTPKVEENWVAMKVGNLLEDLVAEIFAFKTGYKLIKLPKLFYHPTYPFMFANIDYLVELPDGSKAILECKTTSFFNKDKWDNNAVPINYLMQGRHYMSVMNIDKIFYACLYGNSENQFIVRECKRDLEIERELIFYEKEFWNEHVLKKQLPPFTEKSELVEDCLKKYIGTDDNTNNKALVDNVYENAVKEILLLKEEKSALTKMVRELEKNIDQKNISIIEALDNHPKGVIQAENSVYELSYTPSGRTSIVKENLEKLKFRFPKIYDEFVTTSNKRALSVDFVEHRPTTKEEIIGYLTSGLVDWIGESTANQIYNKFKDKTFDIIENNPEKLLQISGITEVRLEDIKKSHAENRSLKDIISFLSPYGISANKAVRIKKAFGANAYSLIKENPFKLCSISGFGFLMVDKIARKLNCSLTDPLRIASAIKYVLEQSGIQRGHLFSSADYLCEESHKLLNSGFSDEVVSMNLLKTSVNSLVQKKELSYEGTNKIVYLRRKFVQEKDTAMYISELLSEHVPKIDIQKYLKKAQSELSIVLSPLQIKAVEMCFNHNFSIITGGPGTGKTTILKVILYIYRIMHKGKEVLLTAPTGRASRRMAESTGFNNACTLHKALGLMADEDGENINDNSALEDDFIIVDEVSMCDMYLAYELFSRIKKGTKVLLVGDVDQLPSIGAGNVFRELLNYEKIPKTVLDMVYRQSSESLIHTNAVLVNEGIDKLNYGSTFEFIECEDDKTAGEIVAQKYIEELKSSNVQNVQVLTPRKDTVSTGSKELNENIRALVNPQRPSFRQINIGKRCFRVNDKVMQIKNVGNVSNGDMGRITNISKDNENKDIITIDFEGRVVDYRKEKMDIIVHAYAITIHKSQGSEFDVVIIPLMKNAYIMLKRNLLYTAITRAKSKVIIVGQMSALKKAIGTNDTNQRNTLLRLHIESEYNQTNKKSA